MAQVTPVLVIPNDSDTTGAVQVTGTGVRISVRGSSGQQFLAVLRMDASGKWFRLTDDSGNQLQIPSQNAGTPVTGATDWSFTIPAAGANEYYNLLLENGTTFAGYAEIESVSAPAAAGGSVPQSRTLTPSNGITLDGATAAVNLSADRTIAFNTAIATCTTSAITLASAVDLIATGGASDLDFSASSGLTKTGTGAVSINGTTTIAANKNLSCSAGTTAVDLSLGTGTFKPTTGTFTFQGKQAATATANTIADPGTGVAIPVTTSGSVPLTIGAGAETNTLAIPTFMGQVLDIFADTIGAGTRAITAAAAINQAGNTIMTFAQARDYIRLIGITVGGALRWQVASNDGVALS